MKITFSIQLKAVLLLFVFSFSTLVSFACAAGFNMGFNQDHHKVSENFTTSENVGTQHNHAGEGHSDAVEGSEKNDPGNQEMAYAHSTESTPDDCCRDEAAKFEKSDKRSPETSNYNLDAPFISLVAKPYINTGSIISNLSTSKLRYFTRNHHPPIADTRIAIQSFLI